MEVKTKIRRSYLHFSLAVLLLFFSFSPIGGLSEAGTESSLIIAADMVRGSEYPMGPVCVLSSRYKQGEHVVWRARIVDAAAGVAVPAAVEELLGQNPSNEDLATMTEKIKVLVHLSDGHVFPMHFGPHPPKKAADYFWTVSWIIPKNYPTGTIDYWITADLTSDGKTGRWDPFNVGYSKLTIEPKW